MTIRRRRLFALPLVALLGGCATKYEGSFNPAFLQRAAPAPDTRAPVRVALWVRPTVHDAVHEGASGGPAQNMRLHLGRIVEEAMASALADVAQGGVQRVAEAAPTTGVAATVEIEAVRVSHDRKLSWMLPIPVFPFVVGDTDFFSQLAFDVSLLERNKAREL